MSSLVARYTGRKRLTAPVSHRVTSYADVRKINSGRVDLALRSLTNLYTIIELGLK